MRNLLSGMLVALVPAMLAAAASATTISETERVCPVGGDTYTSFEINSTSQFGTRLDLRAVGPASNLPWIECPNGFIVFKDESSFTAAEIAALTPVVAAADYQEARTAHMPAYRVYLLQRALAAEGSALAFALLHAAWEAEDAGKQDLRAAYLRDAMAGFASWGAGLDRGSEEWWTAALLDAEIKRQLGDFAGATAAVDALPLAGRPADDVVRQVAGQIRALAVKQDARPAEFAPPG